MRQVTERTIEHVVVTSGRSFDQVKAALEAQLSTWGNADELVRQFTQANATWDQIKHAIEERLGTSGFTVFSKVEQGQLLALAGKSLRVCQYALGNPLLAIEMIEHCPEVALYAPFRITVYEAGATTKIAYDRFTSLLKPYEHPKISLIAQRVEQKLEQLITNALTETSSSAAVP